MKLRADETLRLPELPEQPAGTERVAAIHDRVKTRRRQRLVTVAAACAVLIALIFGYAAAPWHNRALNEPLGDYVPEYVDGHRMVVRMSGDKGDIGRAVATFTPSNMYYQHFVSCGHPGDPVDASLAVFANGEFFSGINCVENRGASPTDPDPAKNLLGPVMLMPMLGGKNLKANEPVTFELKLYTGQDRNDSSKVPPGAFFAFGLAEPVPYEQYPFPSAPAAFEKLPPADIADTDLKNPELLNASRLQIRLLPGRGYKVVAIANTPGILRLTINDQIKGGLSWWDYQSRHNGLFFIAPSGNPTLTLRPEHFGGEWVLWIAEWPRADSICGPGVEAFCGQPL